VIRSRERERDTERGEERRGDLYKLVTNRSGKFFKVNVVKWLVVFGAGRDCKPWISAMMSGL